MIRRIAALTWLNLVQLLRNPSEVVGVIVLPLALTLLFGSAFAGQGESEMRVLVVDEDGSALSARVGTLVDAEPSFETSAVSRVEAERLISEGDAPVAIMLADGFGERVERGDATIEIMRDPGSEGALALSAVVHGIATRMSGSARAAAVVTTLRPDAAFADVFARADAAWEPEPPVSARGEIVVASEVRGDSVMASGSTLSPIGFTVWFILFLTFGSAGGILEERETGTLRRLLVTPSSRTTIMLGKIAGIVVAAIAQASILVGLGALLFGVPWGRDPLAVIMVLGSYILAGTGLAVLVSAVVRTRDQLGGLSPLFATGLAMLGGCLWPIEVLSPVMRTVAKLTPTGWAVLGLTDVVARNQGVASAIMPTLVLTAFALVSLAIGARLLRFE